MVSMGQEDISFWTFIHPRDRPECLGGGVGVEPMEEDNANESESYGGDESEEYSDSEGSDDSEVSDDASD